MRNYLLLNDYHINCRFLENVPMRAEGRILYSTEDNEEDGTEVHSALLFLDNITFSAGDLMNDPKCEEDAWSNLFLNFILTWILALAK